jgi:eukaryotic-like serine/threonine-protein kinase
LNAQKEAWTSTTPARLAGRYWLGEPLGRGRSTVFRAIDTRLDRRVAVKQVELVAGQEDVERVRSRALREAQAAARLNNPRVVTVFDVVEEAGSIWLVMELVDAPSLAQVVIDGGPIPHRRAARIGLDVLTALEAAHVVGVVHRDVKPANVLVQAGDRAKLTDFGVATIRDDSRLTATGMIVGSPSYMSPEQAQGAEVGPPTDLWALGALLYFATEGEPPFHSGSALATASAVVHGEPRPVHYVGPLTKIIARLLTKDPDARPSAGQIRAGLTRVARGQRYRVRTARLPAVAPPPPVAREAAANPTPEVFPPVPAAPVTSPGNPGPALAAGEAEPDVPRRPAPEGPQTDVPPVMPSEPGPTPEPEAPPTLPAQPEPGPMPEPEAPPILPGQPGPTPEPDVPPIVPQPEAPPILPAQPEPDIPPVVPLPEAPPIVPGPQPDVPPVVSEPDPQPVVPQPEPSPVAPETEPEVPPVVPPHDAVVPATPPEVPPGRAESGPPPTAAAAAVGDTRAELTWAQTGTQRAAPSADDVPRRTYRPREQPRSRLTMLAVAAVVVLLVVVAASALTRGDGHGEETTGDDAPATTAAPAGDDPPATTAPPAPETPATTAPATTAPATTAPPAAAGATIPAGWTAYQDPSGRYSIAHPPGWSVVPKTDTITDFRDPATGSYLRVDWTDTPKDDPAQDWREQAVVFARNHDNYQELGIGPTTYRDYNAAVWEFTYGSGTTVHATNLGFVTGGRGYALFFQTPVDIWASSQVLNQQFRDAFRPVPA